MIFAGLSVVFAQRRGDIMVHVETLAYGVDIVIGTPAFQSSFEQSVNKLFIVHIQPYDSVNFGAAFLEKCVKGFGLINGARKAIKDDSFGCFGVGVKLMLKDRNHEVVGDKMSLGNVAVGNFAKFGTLTYVDENGGFGALGHGISDVDTGELLSIADGNLYNAQILGIRKGEKGNPGELSGLIRYEADNILGEISENSKNGIFGTVDADQVKNLDLKKIPVGYKQDLKIGPASVLCCTDGEVKEYAAEITRIDMNHEDSNKSFVIQITDKELLEKTGGIVQGMSGSPVLQNGKLFGAVTHVFVQDSTGGYGIFIENMTGNA